jgi:hypothetical protein
VRSLVFLYVRPHYMAPLTTNDPLGNASLPGNPWEISRSLANGAGHAVANNGDYNYVPASCHSAVFRGPDALSNCLKAHGYHWLVTYQPASRFWDFQAIEGAIFVVLAAVLVLLAFWRVQHMDA